MCVVVVGDHDVDDDVWIVKNLNKIYVRVEYMQYLKNIKDAKKALVSFFFHKGFLLYRLEQCKIKIQRKNTFESESMRF